MTKVSVRKAARTAKTTDAKARKAKVADSYQNFPLNLGLGTNNAHSASTYGFNPVSRIRTLLEWMYRGSWLVGAAVDMIADDMTREGIEVTSDMKDPDELSDAAERLGIWAAFNKAIKWGRLYGGAIAVPLIDGHDMSTPLDPDRIEKGSFKGLVVLDRWMINPALEDMVTEFGPDVGLPKYYTVLSDGPALRGAKIHYTRAFRFLGDEMPYWQQLTENMWSISVLERIYDRLVAFDSATTGAAQLTYKVFLRAYKVKGLRQIVAAGGKALQNLQGAVAMMAQYQSTEGISLIDFEDELEANGFTGFAGIADVLLQFGQQISGALQIPLVRLFGQSPAGLNSTGESDLRTYYDGIKKNQNSRLRRPVDVVYRIMAQSEGIKLCNKFSFNFRTLWLLTSKEKAEVITSVETAVADAFERGIVSQAVAMKELKQASRETGIFSSISDKDIKEADEVANAPSPESFNESAESQGESANASPLAGKSKDSAVYPGGLPIVLENLRGSVRRGGTLGADYGYIVGTMGADGDQMDCFVGPYASSSDVWIIHQTRLGTGVFDEHKVMLGFPTESDALSAYVNSYSDGRGAERVMRMERMSMKDFKVWLKHPHLSVAA